MVSDRHECIFIHLRRTGGNSIEQALGGIVLLDKHYNATKTWDNNLHRGNDNPYKLDYRKHYMHDTAMTIQQQFPEKFKDYSQYYDKESIEIVAGIYKKDIDYFNYEFER